MVRNVQTTGKHDLRRSGQVSPLFEHFVLTRFNVRQGPVRAGDDWLRHRLAYFENVCLKSIRSQTLDSFKWLIFFDAERAEWFENKIQMLSTNSFEPIWIDGPLTSKLIGELIRERTKSPHIITTRLDNDDAVAIDFIQTIQAQFEYQNFQFVNFPNGLQLTDSGHLLRWMDPSGPFISLIEKAEADVPKTVHLAGHDRLRDFGPIKQIRSKPMWVQMIHGENMANSASGLPAFANGFEERFDIEQDVAQPHRVTILLRRIPAILRLAMRIMSNPSRMRRAVALIRPAIAGKKNK